MLLITYKITIMSIKAFYIPNSYPKSEKIESLCNMVNDKIASFNSCNFSNLYCVQPLSCKSNGEEHSSLVSSFFTASFSIVICNSSQNNTSTTISNCYHKLLFWALFFKIWNQPLVTKAYHRKTIKKTYYINYSTVQIRSKQ